MIIAIDFIRFTNKLTRRILTDSLRPSDHRHSNLQESPRIGKYSLNNSYLPPFTRSVRYRLATIALIPLPLPPSDPPICRKQLVGATNGAFVSSPMNCSFKLGSPMRSRSIPLVRILSHPRDFFFFFFSLSRPCFAYQAAVVRWARAGT